MRSSKLLFSGLLLSAVVLLAGCPKDTTQGTGTIPEAWNEPGATSVPGADGFNATAGGMDVPGAFGDGADDGSIDDRTGLMKVNVEGFPVIVYFGYDADVLTSAAAANVARVGAYVKQNGAANNLVLVIEGHCDERGTEEYNRALGERRAIAIETYLKNMGCDLAQIRTVSYGEDVPAVQGSGESVWSQNRRGVMWLGKQKQ